MCVVHWVYSECCICILYCACAIMRGNRVDLKDIVLVQQGEEPENVALLCGETIESDDEGDLQEEEREQVQQVPTPRTVYLVETECENCYARLQFVCRASHPGIRNLQSSLVSGDLGLTCYACVEENGLQGHRQQL